MPPYLAGRVTENAEFTKLLTQDTILENMVLTGLRGVGKTVLLETFKPLAISRDWLWVGTDLSESVSVSEANLAMRLMTDLSVVTSAIVTSTSERKAAGFTATSKQVRNSLDFSALTKIYNETPGLVADKVKRVLEVVWTYLANEKKRGVIFAYDEAQNLADYPAKDQFPMSLMLDVFQSIQRQNIPFMLVLTGLPTLFPKLVEARTFSERMFRVVFLGKLTRDESREAVVRPIKDSRCPVTFSQESVEIILDESGGYPYIIQFICKEVYDVFIQQVNTGGEPIGVPIEAITRKLDSDFFAGRWARATDRQRELLTVCAMLNKPEGEFTVQEVVKRSSELSVKRTGQKQPSAVTRPFGSSHANQMLASLCEAGLIYKNRHGKYSFAVPLLDRFILRQFDKA